MTADRIADALTLLAGAEETYEGAPADTNIARAQVLATIAVAEQLAKLTQLLAPAPDTTGGQAETAPKKTPTPRLMLGDIWETPADGDWTVTDRYGHLMLSRGDLSERYDFTEQRRGPLTLVQRAGCRRTETTVPVWQLKIGQVVSRPEWADGAPVRFVGTFDDVRDLKIIYWPLGGDARSTGTAARDAEATLWTEIDGGAR